jgi:hypothetical protein
MGHTLVGCAAATLAPVVPRLRDILLGSVALDAGSIQPGRIQDAMGAASRISIDANAN